MPTAITAGIDPSRRKMPEIMRVIDEIAFQTSILALHAAVSAAETNGAGSPEHSPVLAQMATPNGEEPAKRALAQS